MPTYQYACTACEHRFEAVQAFTDSALSECPECTGRLRKLYSSVGVVFKGSGFYRTDSRSGGKSGSTASSTADSSTKTESSSKSESSSAPSTSSSSASSSASSSTANSGGTTAKAS